MESTGVVDDRVEPAEQRRLVRDVSYLAHVGEVAVHNALPHRRTRFWRAARRVAGVDDDGVSARGEIDGGSVRGRRKSR